MSKIHKISTNLKKNQFGQQTQKKLVFIQKK